MLKYTRRMLVGYNLFSIASRPYGRVQNSIQVNTYILLIIESFKKISCIIILFFLLLSDELYYLFKKQDDLEQVWIEMFRLKIINIYISIDCYNILSLNIF